MSDIILALRNATKLYAGVAAIENVDFELRRGEIHALVGENGAGKSTLTKVMAGVVTLTSGTMQVDGVEAAPRTPLEARHLGIAMVFQENSLVPTMTVAPRICFWGRSVSTIGCAASTSPPNSSCNRSISTSRRRRRSDCSAPPRSRWWK
jgi:ABC-type sugar transport system ATPase subunit